MRTVTIKLFQYNNISRPVVQAVVLVFASSVPGVSGKGAGCVLAERPGQSHVS